MIELNKTTIESIKKNSNNFSFISTFFELVGNKEFKKAEIDTLYNNVDSYLTSIWRSLSVVAEKLGTTFYSNVLNFIDNVDNIDVCKIASLQSIIDNIGVKYSIFNDIKYMPLDIVNILDILSIKREYLINDRKVDSSFVTTQMSACYYDDPTMVSNLSTVCDSINNIRRLQLANNPNASNYYNSYVTYLIPLSDDLLDEFAISVYNKVLTDKITQTYNDVSLTIIYMNLSNEILLSDFTLQNDKYAQILDYKLTNNLPLAFNVEQEVDNIENGNTTISDYTDLEYGALSIEIERRKESYSATDMKSRYKYYREKEVQEYTNFILNEYNAGTLQGNYAKNSRYDVDVKYIEVYQKLISDKSDYSYKLFKKVRDSEFERYTIEYDLNIIAEVAKQLTLITNAIRDIREQVKIQCQKHFMYGTKMFLIYVVREYLKNNVVKSLKDAEYLKDYEFSLDDTDVDVIEYVDCTNYNNISNDIDSVLSIENTNQAYWNSVGKVKSIGAIDTTDVFSRLPMLEANSSIFSKDNISSLYIDILNNKFDIYLYDVSSLVDSLNKFLHSLFDVGADSSFLYDNTVQTYDSFREEKEYLQLSAKNEAYVEVIRKCNDIISADIPSDVNQHNTTLGYLLKVYLQIINGANIVLNLKSTIADINQAIVILNSLLNDTKDINLTIPLSNMVHELSYKYEQKTNAKLESYLNALMADSFVKYLEHKHTETTLNEWYDNISVSYYDLLAFNEIDLYVHNSLKVANRLVSALLSDISYNISALISDDIFRSLCAYDSLSVLSDRINVADELSSEIEFTSLLETLSSKYYDLIGISRNNYNSVLETDTYKYRQFVYNKYANTTSNDNAYYYLLNKSHPSYALHPYIENYAEKRTQSYPIENMINVDADSIAQMISAKIKDMVDEDGYLISVQYNLVNNNTDYVSRYEYESTLNNTAVNKSVVLSYDGFVYPQALAEFLDKNTVYKITINGEPRASSFIDSLIGDEISGQYYSWNPWYEHLDISKNERQKIAKQLSVFESDITKIANSLMEGLNNYSKYDIYRYGLDCYKNAYCLIKEHNYKDIDDNGNRIDDVIDMKDSIGTIWMRHKDHPIPFPLYTFKKNTTEVATATLREYDIDETLSQITDADNSNLAYLNLKLVNLNAILYTDDNLRVYYKTPQYQDFTFSNDKNLMILNGHVKNGIASYPIIVYVGKMYDAAEEIYLVQHNKAATGDQYLALVDINTLSNYMNGWKFESYFYDNTCIGAVYSRISSYAAEDLNIKISDISIQGFYYEFGSKIQVNSIAPKLVDSISSNIELENICVDTNKWNVTVAYLTLLPQNLSNYIRRKIDLSFMSSTYNEDYLDYAVKTKEYCVGEFEFKDVNEKHYTKYTDIGYYGLLSGENNLGNTYLGKYDVEGRGVYFFLMMTKKKDHPIDFRQTIPVRMYERYDNSSNYIQTYTPATKCGKRYGEEFYTLNLLCAHFYEPGTNDTTMDLIDYKALSSNLNVYSPAVIQSMFDGRNPYIKVDEEFILSIKNDLKEIGITDAEDFYSRLNYPWPFIKNADKFRVDPPEKYYRPYNARDKVDDDNCMFKFSDSNSMPYISVSWYLYDNTSGKKEIQLDFNSYYNKSSDEKLSVNIFNTMNLFLNLEKSGDAGYLRVFEDPLGNNFEKERAKLYIKNISDNKPKFLLSIYNEIPSIYMIFETEDHRPIDDDPTRSDRPQADVSSITLEGIIENYLVNEYVL